MGSLVNCTTIFLYVISTPTLVGIPYQIMLINLWVKVKFNDYTYLIFKSYFEKKLTRYTYLPTG